MVGTKKAMAAGNLKMQQRTARKAFTHRNSSRQSHKAAASKHMMNHAFARVQIPIKKNVNGEHQAMEVTLTLRSKDVAVVLLPSTCSDGTFSSEHSRNKDSGEEA